MIWISLLPSPALMGLVGWALVRGSGGGGGSSALAAPLVAVLGLVAAGLFIVAARYAERWSGGAARGSLVVAVRLSLFEAIAVVGLAAILMTGSLAVYVPFMALSLAGMIVFRPERG